VQLDVNRLPRGEKKKEGEKKDEWVVESCLTSKNGPASSLIEIREERRASGSILRSLRYSCGGGRKGGKRTACAGVLRIEGNRTVYTEMKKKKGKEDISTTAISTLPRGEEKEKSTT